MNQESSQPEHVGQGEHVYCPLDTWHQVPADMSMGEAVGIAVDSNDRVFVFNRGQHPVMVFDADGTYLRCWGEGEFQRPHGIHIDSEDALYLTDDQGHCIYKCTPEGERLVTFGSPGEPSDTGVVDANYRTLQQPAGPFNLPTNLAFSDDGEMFVSDGYGNCCVHRYAATGELQMSWGEPGCAEGQFHLPHGIAVDSQNRVVVADRENSRLQFFTPAGEFCEQWTDVVRPCNVFVTPDGNLYVAEMGWHAGTSEPRPDEAGGRVSVFAPDGVLLSRWGGGQNPYAAGDFIAPHDIWVDQRGCVYVAEVTLSAGVSRGLVTADCATLQKFVPRG